MRYVGSVTVIHQRNRVDAFAVTAPGLEAICAGEAVALGVRPTVGEGGVAWRGSMESVARANLWLRTASRVLVRVAEFKASAFYRAGARGSARGVGSIPDAGIHGSISRHVQEVEALPQRCGRAATRRRGHAVRARREGRHEQIGGRSRDGGDGADAGAGAVVRRPPLSRRVHGERGHVRRVAAPPGVSAAVGQGAASRDDRRRHAPRRGLAGRRAARRSDVRLGDDRDRSGADGATNRARTRS